MEYFKILNLKKEPFSNSPEPEFLYLSENHWECLQKLELAIRLQRGLNVVLGEVGTGKTTLCRHLLIKFEGGNEEERQFETQLILDPDFDSPLAFLRAVAAGFGIRCEEETDTEWTIKEKIKNYLFQKGVEEKKLVLLMIDEGQKLPPYCLEKLREFLNYESNEFKLLQIVIFAQSEFQETFREYGNFADRINQLLYLKPLGFRETRNLIKYRLQKAGNGDSLPAFFNLPAYWTIWRKSGGYPRRIVGICHQILLALIVSGKKKASASLVRASANILPARRGGRLLLIPLSVLLVLLSLVFAAINLDLDNSYFRDITARFTPSETQLNKGPAPGLADQATSPDPAVVFREVETAAESPKINAAPPPGVAAPVLSGRRIPEVLGTLVMERERSLSHLIRAVYGGYTDKKMQAVMALNPHIASPNLIRSGMKITLPASPAETGPPADKPFLAAVATARSLDEAYRLLWQTTDNLPPLRMFIYWNNDGGMTFTLIFKETFYDETEAQRALEKLPKNWSAQARVMSRWDKDTVFISSF
ncbi:MAG: AAA family ATPase [Smithellaceae bacterium]|nr:AAA family ATPase [Smithellaceae bacterium]